jgi:hypothetical protein
MRLLPGIPVDQTNQATDDPAPSLHPHRAKQELPRSYRPVRRRIPQRYSVPCGFSPLGTLPVTSHPGRQYRDAPSHVLCESPDQAHVAYMPDTAWPVSGHPPDSSRAKSKHPVLMPSLRYDTSSATPSARGCAPSSWSPPDASRAPFPPRSPRRSSANAAGGGLKPPPAGRLRRANSFISRTASLPGASPTSMAPFCVRGAPTFALSLWRPRVLR